MEPTDGEKPRRSMHDVFETWRNSPAGWELRHELRRMEQEVETNLQAINGLECRTYLIRPHMWESTP